VHFTRAARVSRVWLLHDRRQTLVMQGSAVQLPELPIPAIGPLHQVRNTLLAADTVGS
jgi:hypothetical protein